MNAHTPEEARELWCPMVRIARQEVIKHRSGYIETSRDESVVVGGCNTDALGGYRVPASCACIADRCAMWRWERTTRSVRQTTVGASGVEVPTYEQRTVRTHGYCGLAPLHAQP